MIEFFSWIASILAVTFTRKQDVQKIIEDQPSRDAYSAKLLEKNQSFAEYLKGFEAFLNKYLGTPARTFLFCLMLALIYSSAVFLFNLAFSKSILDSDKLPAWQSKLLFAGILMTAIVAYGFARIRHAPSEFFENPRSKKISERHYRRIRYKFLPFHLFCATYFAGAIFFVYGSWQLSLFSWCVAAIAALTSTTQLFVQQQFDQFPRGVVAGAALGGLGLLVAILFFAAGETRWPMLALIVGATVLCAALTGLAVLTSTCTEHQINHKEQRQRLSSFCRAPLYVGFYCSRAPGSFCLAVGTLLFACYFMSSFLHVTQEVTVPAAIIITSAIFLAGATTIAGAGLFAVAIMTIVTVFLAVVERDMIFKQWSYLIIFWFIFPLLNAASDFLRWQMVRWGIRYRIKNKNANSVVLLVLDLATAVAVIIIFTMASVYLINNYSKFAESLGYPAIVNIPHLLEAIHSDFWSNGAWLLLMGLTMLIPTLCNLVIYLAAGSIETVPRGFREQLNKELKNYGTASALGRDWLAWKLAAVDSFAGILFFIGVLIAVAYLTYLIAPAFGELLYVLASMAVKW